MTMRYHKTLVALGVLALSSGVAQAQTITALYNFTGADQFFVVPVGVTSLNIEMWGAGGAGGDSGSYGGVGGAGAYLKGKLTVTSGSTLTLIVGQRGTVAGGFNYGGGGAASIGGLNGSGGSGGGRTAIRFGTSEVLTAAGGGGGGDTNGGAGGLLSGVAGTDGTVNGFFNNRGGGGGTQTFGGAAGAGVNPSTAGSQFQGGMGGKNFGGGGGGGYYGGGGGGGASNGSELAGAGGGGSSYRDGASWVDQGSQAGSGMNTAGTGSAHYSGSIGMGGFINSEGGHGRIAITYSLTPEAGGLAQLLPGLLPLGALALYKRRKKS